MIRVRVDGADIIILPTVKGLVSEGEIAAEVIREVRPDAVGISISKEELQALRDKSIYGDYEMSTLEEVYAQKLSKFGEVAVPAPCYVSAMDVCEELGIPIIPLDMNDVEYTEAYCQKIRATDMVRDSLFARRAARVRFDLGSPLTFAKDWDRKVNRTKGFRQLQQDRERHMAATLLNMGRRYRRILAVIEAERADGVHATIAK